MNAANDPATVIASQPHPTFGYRDFQLGSFSFARDD